VNVAVAGREVGATLDVGLAITTAVGVKEGFAVDVAVDVAGTTGVEVTIATGVSVAGVRLGSTSVGRAVGILGTSRPHAATKKSAPMAPSITQNVLNCFMDASTSAQTTA
jgi:hypothetical protein